jgi:hypothetical protein
MIPSFRPGIRSSNRIRAVASADVTPTAIAGWCDCYAHTSYVEDCYDSITNEQITGIDTTITLKVEYANILMQLWVKKNFSTTPTYSNFNFCDTETKLLTYDYNFSGNGWTQLNNNDTFTVVNNDWVAFGCSKKSGTGYQSEAVTLKNVSGGNATIGTFAAAYISYC